MELIVVTPTRLFGEGLAACFAQFNDINLRAISVDLSALRQDLLNLQIDIVVFDVTRGINLEEVRELALEFPSVSLVALGLQEQRQNIIRCGRAGFRGYVDRDATVEQLCQSLRDVAAGRLSCSAEISSELLRALFNTNSRQDTSESGSALTKREGEVLHFIGHGLSNKEIARELTMSVATVKHHVHHVLQKLKLPRRAQAMRRVREAPWIANSPSAAPHGDLD
jgi:two-component system, NarL family, nitrate/nitrite response regulator NarL